MKEGRLDFPKYRNKTYYLASKFHSRSFNALDIIKENVTVSAPTHAQERQNAQAK